jgi:pimeloyl-ACP methyl ester carboxylesterase
MTWNYRIEGEGPPLLLIHGMGVTFTIWRNLAPLLKSHYKLIMVEMPGHGTSPALPPNTNYYQGSAERLEEFRCELGIDKWSVLGYSMGSWVAHAYVQRYIQHVSSVIFLCPGSVNPLWSLSLNSLAQFDSYFPEKSARLLQGRSLHLLVRLLGFNGRNHPYARLWSSEIASQPIHVIKTLLRDLPGRGRAPFSIPPCPAMIIWGAQDPLAYRPWRLRPVDRLVKGNHSAPMLNAEDIARIIRGFNIPNAVTEPVPAWDPTIYFMEGAS